MEDIIVKWKPVSETPPINTPIIVYVKSLDRVCEGRYLSNAPHTKGFHFDIPGYSYVTVYSWMPMIPKPNK